MVGNISNYTRFDIVRCFLNINSNNPISRIQLSQSLNIGEGTIRTILDELKDKGLITSDQNGHLLTKKCEHSKNKITDYIDLKNNVKIDFFQEKELKNTALLLKIDQPAEFDIFQRDVAIKNGADSCLIFNYQEGRLNLPLIKAEYNLSEIENQFHLKENNLLIITFAKDNRWSEVSALSVAEELVKNIFMQIL